MKICQKITDAFRIEEKEEEKVIDEETIKNWKKIAPFAGLAIGLDLINK